MPKSGAKWLMFAFMVIRSNLIRSKEREREQESWYVLQLAQAIGWQLMGVYAECMGLFEWRWPICWTSMRDERTVAMAVRIEGNLSSLCCWQRCQVECHILQEGVCTWWNSKRNVNKWTKRLFISPPPHPHPRIFHEVDLLHFISFFIKIRTKNSFHKQIFFFPV
jgi:hypothetical protein